jgi:GTP-binding protein
VADGHEPWQGELRTSPNGSLVGDRTGGATQFALLNLQDRGALFIAPGAEVYEGMIVGENARAEDMDVNPAKERKLSNVRSSTGEELVRLAPPRVLSLDQALEFIREDEAVEVTPSHVRLRKLELDATVRGRAAKRAKHGAAPDRAETAG